MSLVSTLAIFVLGFLGHRLEPGHIVQISGTKFQLERTVGDDGQIALPETRFVAAAGLDCPALADAISKQIRVARVEVKIVGFSKPVVFFSGSVERPGDMRWREGLTLGDVTILAKPFSGSESFILSAFGERVVGSATTILKKGDRVVYEGSTLTGKILVLGAVRRPGEFAFVSGMTVNQAIASAGGLTANAVENGLTIRRGTSTREPNGEDLLEPGDILTVKFTEIKVWVNVIGAVSRPARLPFSEGMTLLKTLESVGWPLFNALDEILVLRDSKTLKFSYKALKIGKLKDPALKPSDVVELKFKPRKVS